MKSVPLSSALGVEVSGLDLSHAVPAGLLQELRSLLNRHGLLCFHGQSLTPQQQVDLVGEFGPVAPNGDGSL